MTTLFTPGPWEDTYNSRLGRHTIRYVRPRYDRGEDREIAQVLTSLNDARDTANAYLIAAAPELLEALKNLVRHDQAEDARRGLLNCVELERALEVIEKAEGGL